MTPQGFPKSMYNHAAVSATNCPGPISSAYCTAVLLAADAYSLGVPDLFPNGWVRGQHAV